MDLVNLIEAGSASVVTLVLAGLVLGALHGLEPGHAKTMMAAFVIAVRGTVSQAVLLGVSAAFSHSLVVWVLAVAALSYGDELVGERLEPYFMMGSGAIVIVIAAVMGVQAFRGTRRPLSGHAQGHPHPHRHDHFQGHDHSHDHSHDHGHSHNLNHGLAPTHDLADAHARAHAAEIERRFASGRATTWQTVGFGLTGGLIPCPAAITVLILCLHIGKIWLGVSMVAAFSTGLALTLVLVGTVAALGLGLATKTSPAVDRFLRAAPYVSVGLIALIGFYMAWSGWTHLDHGA